MRIRQARESTPNNTDAQNQVIMRECFLKSAWNQLRGHSMRGQSVNCLSQSRSPRGLLHADASVLVSDPPCAWTRILPQLHWWIGRNRPASKMYRQPNQYASLAHLADILRHRMCSHPVPLFGSKSTYSTTAWSANGGGTPIGGWPGGGYAASTHAQTLSHYQPFSRAPRGARYKSARDMLARAM